MKVLHVLASFIPAYRYGGPVRALHKMCQYLCKHGADVTVYTTNINGPDDLEVPVNKEVVIDNVRVWYYPVNHPRSYSYSAGLWNALKNNLSYFDLVHVHSVFNWPATAAMYWARKRKVPYILRPTGMLDMRAIHHPYESRLKNVLQAIKKTSYLWLVDRKNIKLASMVHFTCNAEEKWARWFVGKEIRRFVLPLGIENNFECNDPVGFIAKDIEDISGGRKIIVYMSRLDPKKGIDRLIDSIAELSKNRKDFVFLMIGAGEESFEMDVERMIDKKGIKSITVRKGFMGEERWCYLRKSAIFVLPSYSENFGIAAVEAMAAGVPVVVSEAVGISDEIGRSEAGIVVDGSRESLVSAFEKLLDDSPFREQLKENAKALVENQFNWDRIAGRLLQIYKSIL